MVTWQVNGAEGPRSTDSESYALPALSPHLSLPLTLTLGSTHRLLGEHSNFHLAPAQVFGVREVVLAAHLKKKVVIASR